MRQIITIIFLFFSISGFSQYKNTSDLIAIGDSVLSTTIGAKYLDYYKLDTNSYYEHKNIFSQTRERKLIKNKKVKRRFEHASVKYKIEYPDIKELSSTLYVDLDKNGIVKKYIDDIPNFVLENRECNFIYKTRVVEIGDSLLKEKGIRIEYKLYVDYGDKIFFWEIDNIIQDCTEHKFMNGKKEMIKINPITGGINEQRLVEFGNVF